MRVPKGDTLPSPSETEAIFVALAQRLEEQGDETGLRVEEVSQLLRNLEALLEQRGETSLIHVIGVSRKELPHSRFVAWLLDPRKEHGLRDAFLKAILSKAGVSWDGNLDGMSVEREKSAFPGGVRLLDIIVSHRTQFVVGFENKIRAPINPKQLIEEAKELRGGSGERDVYLTLLCPRSYKLDHESILDRVNRESEEAGVSFSQIDYDQVHDIIQEILARSAADGKVIWMLQDYLRALKEVNILSRFEGFNPAVRLYLEKFDKIDRVRKQFRKDQKLLIRAIQDAVRSQDWYGREGWERKPRAEAVDFFKDAWNGDKDRGMKIRLKLSEWKLRKDSVGVSLMSGKAVKREELRKALGRERNDEIQRLKELEFQGPFARQEVLSGEISFESDPVEAALQGLNLLRELSTTIDNLATPDWRA